MPAEAPDTVPSWARADSSFVGPSQYISVRFIRNIVVLQFRKEATQPQRQRAVDLVSGNVIGGYQNTGIYLVQVADPGDGSAIMRAAERLTALPFVSAASPDIELGPNSLRTAVVPAQAPDSVPAWVRADSTFTGPSAHIPVRFRKNILVVHFRREATQAQRQEAIDLISGTVVGGVGGRTGNGFYLVRVADPGDGSVLVRASDRLHRLPYVTSAGPDIEFTNN